MLGLAAVVPESRSWESARHMSVFNYSSGWAKPTAARLANESKATNHSQIVHGSSVLRAQDTSGLEVCHQGISASDGVWWSGPIKQVPEARHG